MIKQITGTAMALAMAMTSALAAPVSMNSATFTLLDSAGGLVASDNTVTGNIDTVGGAWSVASTTPLFGLVWVAHDGMVFGPGSYTIDTCNAGVASGCGTYTNLTVEPGQLGGHILFDYGSSVDIDVVLVWDIIDNGNGTVTYLSTDAAVAASGPLAIPFTPQPDGIAGTPLIDGPFLGFNANFDFTVAAPPEAGDDAVSTAVDTPVDIDLIANDSAAATSFGDTTAVTPAAVPPAFLDVPLNSNQGGDLVYNGTGSVTYTPPPGFAGADGFVYTITDDAGRVSAPANVSIFVSDTPNTPPVASDTAFVTDEDMPLDIGVNAVATDDDGDSLSFAQFDATSAQGGSVSANADSTVLTYTPVTDFNGTDSFTFAVSDGIEISNVATITVSVNPADDPLACADVTLSTDPDTPLAIDVTASLLAACSDPDGDTITLDSVTQPGEPGSTLSFDGLNTLTYTPAPGFTGQDSFTFTATDGTSLASASALIKVGNFFGNFTMLDSDGVTFGGTNDVVFDWDGTCYNSVAEADAGLANMTMGSESSFPFFGFPWVAHDIKVYCPGGPYTVDTCNAGVLPPDCGPLTFSVPDGHLGGHILLDWNVANDIDIAIVWNNSTGGTWQNVVPSGGIYLGPTGPVPAPDEFYDWISVDADGDGIPGIPMVDGPFRQFRANFSFKTSAANPEPLPVAIDIKPGSSGNVLNPTSRGGIRVAILSDSEFDAPSAVDIGSVGFGPGGAGAIADSSRDVNGDGLEDLLLRFALPDTGIVCGQAEATLTGATTAGEAFAGTGPIRTVGCTSR